MNRKGQHALVISLFNTPLLAMSPCGLMVVVALITPILLKATLSLKVIGLMVSLFRGALWLRAHIALKACNSLRAVI